MIQLNMDILQINRLIGKKNKNKIRKGSNSINEESY